MGDALTVLTVIILLLLVSAAIFGIIAAIKSKK